MYKEKKTPPLPPHAHGRQECSAFRSSPGTTPLPPFLVFFALIYLGPKLHNNAASFRYSPVSSIIVVGAALAQPLRHGFCRKSKKPRRPRSPPLLHYRHNKIRIKTRIPIVLLFRFTTPVKRSAAGAGLRQLPAFRMARNCSTLKPATPSESLALLVLNRIVSRLSPYFPALCPFYSVIFVSDTYVSK